MNGRIFLVYKVSTYERYRRRRQLKSIPSTAILRTLRSAHDEHYRSLESFQKRLKKMGVSYQLLRRSGEKTPRFSKDDLVLSFGGDGTFIYAAHMLRHSALLGINSAPRSSVGYYCRHNADDPDLSEELGKILEEKTRPRKIKRLDVIYNNKSLDVPVLNDVLVTELNPSVTSRYLLRYNGKEQHQKSSGIWISTPWGSTAAFSSAGGKQFRNPNHFRFQVRELYEKKRGSITAGIGSKRGDLRITSAMNDGRLYIDGGFEENFAMGDTVSFTQHRFPLLAFLPAGFPRKT